MLKRVFIFFNIILSMACRFIPEKTDGKSIYNARCAPCHGERGEGLRALIPAVNKLDILELKSDTIICIIRYGIKGNAHYGYQPMPGNPNLEADELAMLWSYLFELAGANKIKKTIADVNNSNCAD